MIEIPFNILLYILSHWIFEHNFLSNNLFVPRSVLGRKFILFSVKKFIFLSGSIKDVNFIFILWHHTFWYINGCNWSIHSKIKKGILTKQNINDRIIINKTLTLVPRWISKKVFYGDDWVVFLWTLPNKESEESCVRTKSQCTYI